MHRAMFKAARAAMHACACGNAVSPPVLAITCHRGERVTNTNKDTSLLCLVLLVLLSSLLLMGAVLCSAVGCWCNVLLFASVFIVAWCCLLLFAYVLFLWCC